MQRLELPVRHMLYFWSIPLESRVQIVDNAPNLGKVIGKMT